MNPSKTSTLWLINVIAIGLHTSVQKKTFLVICPIYGLPPCSHGAPFSLMHRRVLCRAINELNRILSSSSSFSSSFNELNKVIS